jgi:hypothetical protein
MMDIGVAKPSAHGQAMIRTATAAMSAYEKAGAGPHPSQATKVSAAMSSTVGTNQVATRSARRWMGARLRWAVATMCTIWDSSVSAPTLSARMTKPPVWLRVPAVTFAPGSFDAGMDSPVTIDSSTVPLPSTSSPSTGTFSPGRTRSSSPAWMLSICTVSSDPSGFTRTAVLGARSRRALMAPEVFSRARSSSTWPSRTSAVMTAAASK